MGMEPCTAVAASALVVCSGLAIAGMLQWHRHNALLLVFAHAWTGPWVTLCILRFEIPCSCSPIHVLVSLCCVHPCSSQRTAVQWHIPFAQRATSRWVHACMHARHMCVMCKAHAWPPACIVQAALPAFEAHPNATSTVWR